MSLALVKFLVDPAADGLAELPGCPGDTHLRARHPGPEIADVVSAFGACPDGLLPCLAKEILHGEIEGGDYPGARAAPARIVDVMTVEEDSAVGFFLDREIAAFAAMRGTPRSPLTGSG